MISTPHVRAGRALLLLALLLIVGSATAAQGQSIAKPAPPKVVEAVKARLAEIQSAAVALDPDKVFSFVEENDQGALIQDGRLFLTRDDALRSTKRGFRNLTEVSYKFEEQHISILSPTVALATGAGVSSATTSNGTTFEMRFAQSVIFVLTDGEWKVFHAHRSFPAEN